MATLTFENKVAVVTGAGNGLGLSHAKLLAARGAKVVVNDLGGSTSGEGSDDTVAEAVAREINDAGGEAVANGDSVTDGEKIIQCALDNFGGVDIVINNAGILRDKSFHKMSDDDWNLVYEVHLKGAFKVSRAAFQHMREKGYGRFVMTTSAAGIYGNFGQANYSACKLALHGLSQTVAVEGRAKGVKSNTIAPIAGSRLMGTVMDEEAMNRLSPAAVSPLAAWLCHEDCDANGELFEVGAGWISRVRWERSQGAYLKPAGFDPEDVAEVWNQVNDFTDATHPVDTGSTMQAIGRNPNLS
jgi:3-hydroxyacyl-CoA dehydrogenase/3a,7a,12a-trihydroxy-5b-cholest-24-enoyl-CoA hydratase|tara:strand:- start:991 stop:1890 length:900 start_codon:yes stop_codon:yes gene_type:complete